MIYNGEVDVATAGTRVPLASERIICTWLLIQSKPTNTQSVYVGGRTVDSTNGTALVAFDSASLTPM
jgi:hypothetical protein